MKVCTYQSWFSHCRLVCSCSLCPLPVQWLCNTLHSAGLSGHNGSRGSCIHVCGHHRPQPSLCKNFLVLCCSSTLLRPHCCCSSDSLRGSEEYKALRGRGQFRNVFINFSIVIRTVTVTVFYSVLLILVYTIPVLTMSPALWELLHVRPSAITSRMYISPHGRSVMSQLVSDVVQQEVPSFMCSRVAV